MNGKVGILKIKGTENPADLMTKFTDLATLDKLCGIIGLLLREGRAAAAPKMAKHAQMDGQAPKSMRRRTRLTMWSASIMNSLRQTQTRRIGKVSRISTSMKFCGNALPRRPHRRLLLPAPCLRQVW